MEVTPWIDTTRLPDILQRQEPTEIIGQVFGTSSTLPYIHLQLEMSRRLFGHAGIPTLVANDGDDRDAQALHDLATEYGADFICWPKIGHAQGDLRIFKESMQWAKSKAIDVVAKFSRRFIPLVSWRHGLQYLAAFNTGASCFTRRHLDAEYGLFRTDAIAFRPRLLDVKRVNDTLDEAIKDTRSPHVENMFDSFQRVTGGWVLWDLLGPNFYKPWNKAMQWRGLLPYHYGDLARALDLPYADIDFLPASAVVVSDQGRNVQALRHIPLADEINSRPAPAPEVEIPNPHNPAGVAYVIQQGGDILTTDPNDVTPKTPTPTT